MRYAWIALLLIGLAGCDRTEMTQSVNSNPIRIGTNVWPGYEPLYLARELDGWSDSELRLVEYPSASEVLRAFRNKALEAASLTLDEVLLLRQQNIPVSIVLVHDISEGADVILAKPEIKSMQELKKRRVGVEAGALGALVLTRALEINQMSLSDITVINKDVNMHESAFLADEVDAVVTFEPIRTRLLNQDANEIFTSREIPGEVVDVLVVHTDNLEQHPETIRKLIHSWFKTLTYMQTNMDDAAARMAKRLNISATEVTASYEGLLLPSLERNKQLLTGPNAELLPTLEKLNAVMLNNRLLEADVDIKDLLRGEFIP